MKTSCRANFDDIMHALLLLSLCPCRALHHLSFGLNLAYATFLRSTPTKPCVQELQKDEVPEVDEDLDSESSESTGNFVSRAVEKALSLPGLSLLKPFLIGWLTTLAANTLIAVATVAVPAVLFLVLLYSLFSGKKASSVVMFFSRPHIAFLSLV